jgi:hypothetical protein
MTAGIPVIRCPVCQLDVPTGAFCGTLRRALISVSRSWPQRAATRGIRGGIWRTHAAAVCGQLVNFTPAATSRAPFRIALAVLFLALVALGLLRWQAPLIAVSARFSPLFLFYLHGSDMDDDLPLSSLVLTALLGLALGVRVALLTGDIVAGPTTSRGRRDPTDRSILSRCSSQQAALF